MNSTQRYSSAYSGSFLVNQKSKPCNSRRITRIDAGLGAKYTFGEICRVYVEDHAKPHLATWKNYERMIRSYFSEFEGVNCANISRFEVQRWHTRISREHGRTAANRACELMRSVFNKAIDWELIPAHNPAAKVTQNRLKPRDRFLQPEELSCFFAAISTLRYDTTRDLFHMLLFTGQRLGNVRQMRWSDVNFNLRIWTIPETKNGTSHKVPLLPEAIAILMRRFPDRSSEWVFNGRPTRGSQNKPVGRNGCQKAWAKVVERAGLDGLKMHDLRRSLASYQAINGTDISIIAKTLNHKDLASTSIYARLHLEPVREAMGAAVNDMCSRAGLASAAEDGAGAERVDVESRLALALPAVDELVDTLTAAEILGVSSSQLEQMRFRNEGPPYLKYGISVRYSRNMLIAWRGGRQLDAPLINDAAR